MYHSVCPQALSHIDAAVSTVLVRACLCVYTYTQRKIAMDPTPPPTRNTDTNAHAHTYTHTYTYTHAYMQHKFAWIRHPSPQETQRALEKERGITGALRMQNVATAAKDSRTAYDPLLMLEGLVRGAKRYQPA